MIHVSDCLAVRAKKGDRKALLQVWKDSHRIRGRVARLVPLSCREDWTNESFLVLLQALKNYKKSLGHFDPYLTVYLVAYRSRFLTKGVVASPARSKESIAYCELDDERDESYCVYENRESILMPRLLRALQGLGDRELTMVSKYFGLFGFIEHTYQQANDGVTRQRTAQIIQKSVEELGKIVESRQKTIYSRQKKRFA